MFDRAVFTFTSAIVGGVAEERACLLARYRRRSQLPLERAGHTCPLRGGWVGRARPVRPPCHPTPIPSQARFGGRSRQKVQPPPHQPGVQHDSRPPGQNPLPVKADVQDPDLDGEGAIGTEVLAQPNPSRVRGSGAARTGSQSGRDQPSPPLATAAAAAAATTATTAAATARTTAADAAAMAAATPPCGATTTEAETAATTTTAEAAAGKVLPPPCHPPKGDQRNPPTLSPLVEPADQARGRGSQWTRLKCGGPQSVMSPVSSGN